jgi:hypothetical protein
MSTVVVGCDHGFAINEVDHRHVRRVAII